MSSETPSVSFHRLRQIWAEHRVFVVVFTILAFLFLFRLADFPGTHYDEGAVLHVSKNFALNGIYADYSSEGNRPYGPSVGTGPTLLVPIAILFKLFEVNISIGRLVVVFYSLIMLIAIYGLARRLLDRRFALVATLLLVLTPSLTMYFFGRTVLGEVPAICLCLLALLLWLESDSHQIMRLFGTGVLFGLACITKPQWALFILPALLICWLADRIWYHQRRSIYFVIPGIMAGVIFAGWLYLILYVISAADGVENIAALQGTASYALFVWKTDRALGLLVQPSTFVGLLIPALIYSLYRDRKRSRKNQEWSILNVFVGVALAFFASSLAWPRYGFPALGLGSILVARLLYDLTNGFRPDWQALAVAPIRMRLARILINGGTLIFLVIFLAASLYIFWKELRTYSMAATYATAAYINEYIPPNAIIETWEQEMAVLTDHRYHYPPQFVDAENGREEELGLPEGHVSVRDRYDFRDYVDADYVVVGFIGRDAGLYEPHRLQGYELIKVIDSYHIYQKQSATN